MVDRGSPVELRPWLFAAGVWGLLALVAFVDPRPPDGAWGMVGWLAFRPATRATVVVLLALAVLPPLTRRLLQTGRPCVARIGRRLAGVPPWVWIALLVAAAWVLRGRLLGGDGPQTIDLLEGGELINTKEPLDRLVTAMVFRGGRALFGWDAGAAIALVSTLAGAIFWAGLLRLGRRHPVAGLGAWPVRWLLGTTGAVALFCGHVENYSLLTAGTLWTLALALDAVERPKRPLWPVALVFGVTVATHLAAVWLAPALVAVWWRRAWSAGDPLRAGREAVTGLVISLLPLVLVIAGMAIGGLGLEGFSASNFGGGDGRMFVPLLRIGTPYERYTMFSATHLEAVANEMLLVAPVGTLLVVVGGLGHRRIDGRGNDGSVVLGVAALGTVAYAFTFNPDMMVFYPELGPLAEWDLFAFLAVPVTLLGIRWLGDRWEDGEERTATALAAVLVSTVSGLAWVLFNATLRV